MFMVSIRNTLLVQVAVVLRYRVGHDGAAGGVSPVPGWHNAGNWRWLTVALIAGVVGIAGNQLRVSRKQRDFFVLQSARWTTGLVSGVACLGAAAALGWWFQFNPFPVGPTGQPVSYTLAAPIALLLVVGGFFLLPVGAKLAPAEIDAPGVGAGGGRRPDAARWSARGGRHVGRGATGR